MFAQVEFALNVDLISDRLQTDSSTKPVSPETGFAFDDFFGSNEEAQPLFEHIGAVEPLPDYVVGENKNFHHQSMAALPIPNLADAKAPIEKTPSDKTEPAHIDADDPIVAEKTPLVLNTREAASDLIKNSTPARAIIPMKEAYVANVPQASELNLLKGDPPNQPAKPEELKPESVASNGDAKKHNWHQPTNSRADPNQQIGDEKPALRHPPRPDLLNETPPPRLEEYVPIAPKVTQIQEGRHPSDHDTTLSITQIRDPKSVFSVAPGSVETHLPEYQRLARNERTVHRPNGRIAHLSEAPSLDPHSKPPWKQPDFEASKVEQLPIIEGKKVLTAPAAPMEVISKPPVEGQTLAQTAPVKAAPPAEGQTLAQTGPVKAAPPAESILRPVFIGMEPLAQNTVVDSALVPEFGIAKLDVGEPTLRFLPTDVGSIRGASLTPILAHEQVVIRQIAANTPLTPSGRIVEIALDPVELGRVRMTVSQTESGVTLSILADRLETLELMRRNATTLSEELSDLGYDSVELSFSSNEYPHAKHSDDQKNTAERDDFLQFEDPQLAEHIQIRLTNPNDKMDVRL